MVPVKFIRSLAGDNLIYPNYGADAALASAVSRWSRRIKLAGMQVDLDVPATSVLQATSSSILNRHVFVASVDDREAVQRVVDRVRSERLLAGAEKRNFAFPTATMGGLLYLQRHIGRRFAKTKDGDGPEPPTTLRERPYYVEDVYWLTVLDDRGVPAFDVHHDSASFTFVDSDVLTRPGRYAGRLRETFPEPDEVIVDWHDLAEILSLSSRLDYVYAALSAAGICRYVWGYGPWGVRQVLYPADPAIAADRLPYRDFAASGLQFLNAYAADPAGGSMLLPPEIPFSDLQALGPLRLHLDPAPPLRPAYRGTPLCDAFIDLLRERSGEGALYRGDGYFSVRSASLKALAAGTGNWGSGEIGLLAFSFELIKDGAAFTAPASGAAGLVATGASLWRSANAAELADERELCRTSTRTTGECVNCVMSGGEGVSMIVEGVAGGAGVVLGLAAATAATGVGVPIAIALAIAGGILIAVDIGVNAASIQQSCAGDRP